MPKYKLTYFNGRARGELTRMLFAAADKPFEDMRVEFPDWPKLKGEMPQGSLPVLQIDGKTTVCQSLAIARYLAREFGYYGKRKEDDVITDQILDTLLDTFTPYSKLIFNPNADEKKKQMAEFYEKTLPTELGYLVELVKKTGNKGFAVGSALSLSDLAIYVYIENCGADAIAKLKDYPLLAANRKKVEENPRIANYLKKRPVTDF